MKRVWRIFLYLATVMSLAVAVTIGVAFIRSDLPGDQPWHWGEFKSYDEPYRRVVLARTQLSLEVYRPTGRTHHPGSVDWSLAGFELSNQGFLSPVKYVGGTPVPDEPVFYFAGWRAVIPFWLLFPVALILPTLGARQTMRRLRTRRRRLQNRCGACGYDLRATPARCPECGATTVET